MPCKAKYGFMFLVILLSAILLRSDASGQQITYRDIKCAAEKEQETPFCLQHRAAMLISGGDVSKERAELAVELLKKALAIDPWHDYLLSTLAQAYINLKEYQKALNVLNCLIQQRPWYVGIRSFRCMLIEDVGCSKEEARACYHDVAHRYKKIGITDANYVIAALLAEDPNAEAIKQDYFKLVKPGNTAEYMWDNFIKDFDREKYVKQMKLVDPKYEKKFNLREADKFDCSAYVPKAAEDANKKRSDAAIATQKKARYFRILKWQKLYGRALEFAREKDFHAALMILDREPDIGMEASNAALLRCTLKEKARRSETEYKACYRRLLKAYESIDATHSPTYLRIGILAYWPDKERIKERVLSRFQPGSKAQKTWTKYLDALRRQDVLDSIYPW